MGNKSQFNPAKEAVLDISVIFRIYRVVSFSHAVYEYYLLLYCLFVHAKYV